VNNFLPEKKIACVMAILMSTIPNVSLAFTIPGVADPGRISPKQDITILPLKPAVKSILTSPEVELVIPESAKNVNFKLNSVVIKGVSAFQESALSDIYASLIGNKVTLEQVYIIARKITERYREKGYFLSRAYILEQEIVNGNLTIGVVEGFIGDVAIEGEQPKLILSLIDRLKKEKPVSAYSLESFMLQMNSLPGTRYVASLEPLADAEEGAVKLQLQAKSKKAQGSVSFDNFGSKFLGPYGASLNYKQSIIPLHETTFSSITSVPTKELNYFGIDHSVSIFPDWKLKLGVNMAKSHPGDALTLNDISGNSTEMTVGFTYQPMRQIQQNLIFTAELSGRNTNSDFLGDNPLTRDRIRLIRAGVFYDRIDSWNGYHGLRLEIEKGIDGFGSSDKGDADLSRIGATSDFTVLNIDYQQQRKLGHDWLAIAQVSAQNSSAPLFSALQFGYGGQTFGRAYNPSEITGDEGVASMIELRYDDLGLSQKVNLSPYAFYDIGKVWNQSTNGENSSAASAGFGMRISHDSGISSNLGLAWPLTKDASNPIYDSRNGKEPRLFFLLLYQF
jgi:hemolysin activation/secretion protein